MKLLHFLQETAYTCGPAVMRMILASAGISKTEKQVAKLLQTTHVAGTRHRAFPALAESLQWNYIVARDTTTLADVAYYLKKKYFVVVCYFHEEEKSGHYALVGKLSQTTITLLDPIEGEAHTMNRKNFERLWAVQRSGRGVDTDIRWLCAMKPTHV